jgi:hypothetical protein
LVGSRLRRNQSSTTNNEFPTPDWVANANIEHYKKLLEAETDAEKRAHLEKLLSEEEAKLAALRQAERREG